MKNLLLATALTFGMTASALAAAVTLQTAGGSLAGSDVRATDGSKVGVVQSVIDDETIAVQILTEGLEGGEVVELKRENFAIIEEDSDADLKAYQINLNDGVMLK